MLSQPYTYLCFQKCDGARPTCSRCSRLGRQCDFSGLPPRRRRVDILEERALELQLQLAELCGTHDRVLLSNQLFDKLELLNRPPDPLPERDSFPMYPCTLGYQTDFITRGEVFPEDMEYGYRPIIRRNTLEAILDQWTPNSPISTEDALYL